MIATEEVKVCCDQPDARSESAFGWEWRVMAVTAFWVLPGAVLGALARLCVPDGGPVAVWLVGFGLLAAVFGGLLEADHFKLD